MKVSVFCFIISASILQLRVNSNPIDLSPNHIFGSIKNVTLGATSFISDSIQKQTEILIHAKDTAKDYVTNAVAVPAKIFNNAKDATRDYIDSTASKGMEIKVRSVMEIVRQRMPYGMPLLDLPVLDPLKIEHFDFETNCVEIGNLSMTIDNVTIYKLSTFVADHVQVKLNDGLSLALNISVPKIPADGLYKVNGSIARLLAVNGSGDFELEITDTKVYLYTVLGFSTAAYVKYLDIDFSIGALKAVFQNLFPDPEVNDTVNQVISMMAPEILDVIKPELKPMLEEIIAERINATVGRLTMGNIIPILTGTGDHTSLSHAASTPPLTV